MEIVDLLVPEAVLPSLKAQSKKQLLQELAQRASELTGLPERRVFETLIDRKDNHAARAAQTASHQDARKILLRAKRFAFVTFENFLDATCGLHW